MSRRTINEYKLPDGNFVLEGDESKLPEGSVLWNGYDYGKQQWVHNGAKDERTPEELTRAMESELQREELFKKVLGTCIEPRDALTDEDVVKIALAAVHAFGEKYGVRFEYLLK